MAVETELKLRVPAYALSALRAHPLLANPAPGKDLWNTYFDTRELALLTQRVALRERRQGDRRLLTVKRASPAQGGLSSRDEWEIPWPELGLCFDHIDAQDLREFLTGVAPALTPVFTTHFHRETWVVNWQDFQVEIALDQGHIESAGRQQPILELELELLRQEAQPPHPREGDALFSLAQHLATAADLQPEPRSKAERGYRTFLLDQTPLRPVKAGPSPVHPEMSPRVAFLTVAEACLNQLDANEEGLQGPSPGEFVHQMRVALRRLRAALKLFSPDLPKGFSAEWNARWRTVGNHLGAARNWEVLETQLLKSLATRFPKHGSLPPLRAWTSTQRELALNEALARLGLGTSPTPPDPDQPEEVSYPRLRLDFAAALHTLGHEPPAGKKKKPGKRPRGDSPGLGRFARRRLRLLHEAIQETEANLAQLDPPARHGLRICCKRLRYGLEFLAPSLPEGAPGACLASLCAAQDYLGRLNDLYTAADLLGATPPDPALEGGALLAQAWIAGELQGLERGLSGTLAALYRTPLPHLPRGNAKA